MGREVRMGKWGGGQESGEGGGRVSGEGGG